MAATHKRIAEAVEDYIQYREARFAESGVTQDAYVLRRFAAAMGDVQLRHLTAEKVTDWFYGPSGLLREHVTRDGVRRPAVKASTHNYYRVRLASLFRFAQQRGWLKQDLLADVPPMKEVRRQRQQPPPEVLLAMLDVAANPRDRAYLATTINTALRANEIIRIRVRDVDLEAGSLNVVISKTHEEDTLPISSDLDAELRRWLATYAKDVGRPLHGDDHLFPARKGPVYEWRKDEQGRAVRGHRPPTWRPDRPVSHTERIVQEALRALGLPTKHEGSHTIRRAVARAFFDSMAGEAGYDASLRTVSALLHHKSASSTETYLGLSSEKERRDKRLRGQPFLSAMVPNADVLDIDRASGE